MRLVALICAITIQAAGAAGAAQLTGGADGTAAAAAAAWGPHPHVGPHTAWQQQQQQQQQQHRPLLQDTQPYVVAHRGASGLLPEHMRPAYQLAIDEGADFIECDAVVTRDLALICRHEPNLNDTTDAAARFSDRAATYTIDGEEVRGVFAADLSLAEVRQLRARQRWAFRDHSHDGRYGIVTFEEFLDLALSANRSVGVYPEAKHPAWHNQLPALRAANTTIEQLMVAALHARGYGASAPAGSTAWRAQPVFIQAFEVSSLRRFSRLTDIPLALLVGGWPTGVDPDTGLTLQQLMADDSLASLSPFVTVVCPWKAELLSVERSTGALTDAAGHSGGNSSSSSSSSKTRSSSSAAGASARVVVLETSASELDGVAWLSHPDAALRIGVGLQLQQQQHLKLRSTGLAERLQRHGFQVHTFTLRDESQFVLPTCEGDVACEYRLLFNQLQLNGGFTDHPKSMLQFFQRT